MFNGVQQTYLLCSTVSKCNVSTYITISSWVITIDVHMITVVAKLIEQFFGLRFCCRCSCFIAIITSIILIDTSR